MADQNLLLSVEGGIARVTLNRPEVHNAFDEALIEGMFDLFTGLAADRDVRVVLLAGNGKSFSAGADLNWMKRTAAYDEVENRADARRLGEMLHILHSMPKPSIALVQGGTYGGGLGLVSACDMALAAEDAVFALTEVRLGLIPAVNSPYVVAAIGRRAAHRYFLTGERFAAAEALRIGLVHDVVPGAELMDAGMRLADSLLKCGPDAVGEAKKLIAAVADRPIDEAVIADTADRIAARRASPEGKEGIGAFLEKRKPAWLGKSEG
jgi:methylglutaconyl-CoA hydratase